jgi:hypothetical protein
VSLSTLILFTSKNSFISEFGKTDLYRMKYAVGKNLRRALGMPN